MSVRAKITGTGMYVPERVVTNEDLTHLMDTTEEWIEQRTGIRERRWIQEGQQPADLAHAATLQALEAASITPADVDLILLATLSAQADFPCAFDREQEDPAPSLVFTPSSFSVSCPTLRHQHGRRIHR